MNTTTETIEQTMTNGKVKRLSGKKIERQEAIERMREWVKPGDTLLTILRHVSASGMLRVIDVVKIMPEEHPGQDPRVLSLGFNIAKIIDAKYDREKEGMRISGCGSDMGFEVVYNLGRILFRDGFAVTETARCTKCLDRPGRNGLGKTCQECDGKGTVTTPVRGRNGDMSGWDKDGGYALKQRWL